MLNALTSNDRDGFGNRHGSKAARANAVLTTTPKKMKQIMAEAGLDATCYNHLNKLVEDGQIRKTAAGYARTGAQPEPNDQVDGLEDGEQEPSTEFAYEADLRDYLAGNLSLVGGLIGLNLELYTESGIKGTEFPVGGRFIDILARATAGELVVIELKVSRGYDRVIGQLMRYMAWVKRHKAAGRPVHGVIVARKISDDLKLACSLLPENVHLLEYKLKVDIQRSSEMPGDTI